MCKNEVWPLEETKGYARLIESEQRGSLNNDKKQEDLKWRNTLPRKVKSYVDTNLYPIKVNVID